ncbi:MAG: glycosyltransferase family 2 protein [Firmicutes bacterium]|nr:glycosyltransferase family 2 protein [Bacillota bacterium]
MLPEISVVIPTFNRKAILKKCLLSLLDQDFPTNHFEVVIIDDGSTDGTREMIQQLQLPEHFRYIYQENQGRSRARNNGIKAARGRIIVFLDSDMVVTPAFLRAHYEAHQERNNLVVHGPVIHTTNFDDPTSEKWKLTDHSAAFFATANTSVRKEHLVKVGLFDEDFTKYGWEDLELGMRLRKTGLVAVKAPKAVGYHYDEPIDYSNLAPIIQKEKERGEMALLYYRKQPHWRVRLSTMLHPFFFGLERVLTVGNWQDHPRVHRYIQKKAGKSRLANLALFFVKNHAYFEGMRQALRKEQKAQSSR